MSQFVCIAINTINKRNQSLDIIELLNVFLLLLDNGIRLTFGTYKSSTFNIFIIFSNN